MAILPSYHVRRTDVLDEFDSCRVFAFEAPAGWGKSTALDEMANRSGTSRAIVSFRLDDDEPVLVAAALRQALRREGLTRLCGPLTGPEGDLDEIVEGFLEVLAAEPEPLYLVMDDVHRLTGPAESLVARIIVGMPKPHRLAIGTRALGSAIEEALLAVGGVIVGADQLAFSAAETDALLRVHGVSLDQARVAALTAMTGGWAAALHLAAARLRLARDPELQCDTLVRQPVSLRELMADQVSHLDPTTAHWLSALARLPLLDPALVSEISGSSSLWNELRLVGVPVTRRGDGWWIMPDPVRAALGHEDALDERVGVAAAQRYAERGDELLALRVLIEAGAWDALAARIVELGAPQRTTADFSEYHRVLCELPMARFGNDPTTHLVAAGFASKSYDHERASLHFRRAEELTVPGTPERRRVDAERLATWDSMWPRPDAERSAIALLAAAGEDELATRGLAHQVLGRIESVRYDDPGALGSAERHLSTAIGLFETAGMPGSIAMCLVVLGYYGYFFTGRDHLAVDHLQRGYELLSARPIRRPAIFLQQALVESGRYAEADAHADTVRSVARRSPSSVEAMDLTLMEMVAAAQKGERQLVGQLLDRLDLHRSQRFDRSGNLPALLAHCARSADMVHEHDRARGYLQELRTLERGADWVEAIEAVCEARHGDLARAEELLGQVVSRRCLEPRYLWWVRLHQAAVVARRGDIARARTLGRDVFDACAAVGTPHLLRVSDPEAAAEMTALLRITPDEPELESAVRAIGRFEVVIGGRPTELPSGQPAGVVKLLAAHGGRLHAEQVMTALWESADRPTAQTRLRNVLARLRRGGADLVERDGEHLVLQARSDVALFQAQWDRLQQLTPSDPRYGVVARSALALCSGELLPDDLYEEWAVGPRELLRQRRMELLELLADRAAGEGDLDGATSWLRQAIDLDPLDEDRYVRMAGILLTQGRRGAAQATLGAARSMLEDLAVEPSRAWQHLSERIAIEHEPVVRDPQM